MLIVEQHEGDQPVFQGLLLAPPAIRVKLSHSLGILVPGRQGPFNIPKRREKDHQPDLGVLMRFGRMAGAS